MRCNKMGILELTPEEMNADSRRRTRPKGGLVELDCDTGISYLVVVSKGKKLCTAVDGRMVQTVIRFIWTAYRNPGSEKAYFKTAIRMSDGKKKEISLHRFIHIYLGGELPAGLYVDHRDRNPFNNRLSNLRPLPPQLNSFNSDRVLLDGTSRYPGVGWHAIGKNWRAITTINKKQTVLGHYDLEEEAARRMLDEMIKVHPKADWDALSAEFFPGITPTKVAVRDAEEDSETAQN